MLGRVRHVNEDPSYFYSIFTITIFGITMSGKMGQDSFIQLDLIRIKEI